jgi:hypothetical protein
VNEVYAKMDSFFDTLEGKGGTGVGAEGMKTSARIDGSGPGSSKQTPSGSRSASRSTSQTDARVRSRRRNDRTDRDAEQLRMVVEGRFSDPQALVDSQPTNLDHFLFEPVGVSKPSIGSVGAEPNLRRGGYDGHKRQNKFNRQKSFNGGMGAAVENGLVPVPRSMTKNYYRH